MGGTTINNWGRYELGQYYTDFNNMMSEETRKKISSSDALLIDEISMLDGQTLDCLECMVAIIRHYDKVKERIKEIKREAGDNDTIMSTHMLNQRWVALGDIEPWGGLQVIFVGDFFQLPPVPNGYDVLMENEYLTESGVHLKIGRQGSYAFESRCWQLSNLNTIELTQVHRQAGNDGLFQCLNAMREGQDLTPHSSVLTALQQPLDSREDGLLPTELYSKNYIVDRRNREELAKIQAQEVVMNAFDCVEFDPSYKALVIGDPSLAALSTHELLNGDHKDLKWDTKNQLRRDFTILTEYAQEHFFAKSCRANQTTSLKEGAQALLLWNLELESKLANGSRGVVEAFVSSQAYTDLVRAELKTRDDAADTMEGSLKAPSGEPDSDMIKSIKSTLSSTSTRKLENELKDLKVIADSAAELRDFPFVRFANGRKRVIRPQVGAGVNFELLGNSLTFKCRNPQLPQAFEKEFKGCGTATRWQVPLTLAWAISIHKSQGMTIEWLKVDLQDCFAIGQAYVACSRGKGVQSMSVVNYDPREIKVSDKVKRFATCVQQGKPYDGPLWHDTLAEFDRLVQLEIQQQKRMKSHYTRTERRQCDKCGAVCVLNQIKSNAKGNQGKYFVSCPNGGRGEQGHTWELVNTLPLKCETVTPAKAAEAFKHYIPGQGGAIPGRLDGLRFVCSGVFPELGGGFGLKLGRDNLKEVRMVCAFLLTLTDSWSCSPQPRLLRVLEGPSQPAYREKQIIYSLATKLGSKGRKRRLRKRSPS